MRRRHARARAIAWSETTSVPEQGVWRFARRVSRRSCRICPESRFSLAEDGWVYDPEAPLPQMAHFTELIPELRNGTLYLRLPKTDAP